MITGSTRYALDLDIPGALPVVVRRPPSIVGTVARALAASGLPAGALQLEVTESLAVQDAIVQQRLGELKALGLTLALDDFGTGYSSLAYIVTLPIDELKIDRAFVKKITADPAYVGIVRTCVSLARGLNLKVVAEGVETEGQAAALRALGCDQAQGFYYSPPVPADQLVRMLKSGSLQPPGA